MEADVEADFLRLRPDVAVTLYFVVVVLGLAVAFGVAVGLGVGVAVGFGVAVAAELAEL